MLQCMTTNEDELDATNNAARVTVRHNDVDPRRSSPSTLGPINTASLRPLAAIYWRAWRRRPTGPKTRKTVTYDCITFWSVIIIALLRFGL